MSGPDPDFTSTRAVFEENFARRGEIGAGISVWRHGREILNLSGGTLTREGPDLWTSGTVVPVWSATKGPAALTLLLTLHEAGLSPDAPVRPVWPQLALPVTFGELLSHQAGLCALDTKPSVFDHAAVAAALQAQTPVWTPGGAHGYHPRTFGFLADECVRRLTGGQTLAAAWRERIAAPLALDFWIDGPPDDALPRVARLYPGKLKPPVPEEAEFFTAMADPASLTRRSFASPAGLHAVAELNQPAAWRAGLAAFGGVGSARALAEFYNILACGGVRENRQVIPAEVVAWAGTRLVSGPDRVLRLPSSFSAGFMMDPLDPHTGGKLRTRFGSSPGAFGHPGAGGSQAFADPARGLSFAYVMNQMEQGVLPNAKSLLAVQSVLDAVDAADSGQSPR
ncbi:MAG: serine hydrolase domain-containing protein [Verrucomicrobiota bacterium]